MKIIDVIKESLRSLRVNLKRTFLTVLGIVIGIFAVTIMLSVGDGVKKSISASLQSATNGDISVNVFGKKKFITISDVDWVKKQLFIENVLALNDKDNESLTIGGHAFSPTVKSIYGPYDSLERLKYLQGKGFDWNSLDSKQFVVVIDSDLAQKIQKKIKESPLGKEVFIKNKSFKIIGILKSSSGLGQYSDGTVFMPVNLMNEFVMGRDGFQKLAVHLKNPNYYDVSAKHILKSFNLSRNLDEESMDFVSTYTPKASMEQMKKITEQFNLLLGIIGGISLLVGGIGTMNMMLTTISERTKEIGLRKAIGAKNGDITWQILFESIFVTLIGGIIGILFTAVVVFIVNPFIPEEVGFKLSISVNVISIAVLVSVIVGVVFGVSPAKKAAKLQPVDALRSD